jgi:hydrogenase maturation protein HypF
MSVRVRRRLDVSGVVQGVGFRPFVFRLATQAGLGGFVQNLSSGVAIEVEGDHDEVETFVRQLAHDAPPLARVRAIEQTSMPPEDEPVFEIRSSGAGAGRAWLPPDIAPCEACLQELRGVGERRGQHPFISCTDCGPRFSIVEAVPFDRVRTTMAGLSLCADCRDEFERPGDRRFHAQTIACRRCGPRLAFAAGDKQAEGDAAMAAALDVLASGGIVAVKGVGAYHLSCDAHCETAVAALRRRKGRPDKPFAVLAADVDAVAQLVALSGAGREALGSAARPIVIAPAGAGSGLAAGIARHVPALGVMLPPSPLHAVLAESWRARRPPGSPAALVMTSANGSDLPAIVDDDQARAALAGVADAWLGHDRRIAARCDDAVVADAGSAGVVPLRLGRGTSPTPMALPHVTTPTLAVGGELKAACCLAMDGHAVMSPHIGDMGTAETLDAMAEAVDHLCGLLRVEPEIFVCDAHPGYLSSRWADDAAGGRAMRVQHHHAHAAALMAEHELTIGDRLVTVCFDGTGYGDDGAIWGGEVLDASYAEARRLAHLAYAPLPGGDAAIRQPARAAYAYLRHASFGEADLLPCGHALPAPDRRVLAQQLEGGQYVAPTSSVGRLFDVVAAICGLAVTSTYEGQAAMALEACAAPIPPGGPARYAFEGSRSDAGTPLVIHWVPVVAAIAADVRAGVPVATIAAAFHDALAEMVVKLVRAVAPTASRVGLTGGVFQNVRLLRLVCDRLDAEGVTPLTHRVVPPNDGGLSLGQVAVAAAHMA